jgi:hypothetical protein
MLENILMQILIALLRLAMLPGVALAMLVEDIINLITFLKTGTYEKRK